MPKFYLTNAIPYVNAKAHVGHALEIVMSDVLARYHRDVLHDETFFLFGTDENALKNVQSAEKAGKPVAEFVDEHTEKFAKLLTKLNISNDGFIRTTEDRHVRGAQKLWNACAQNGDIYKKTYKGLYCVGCEDFYKEKDLIDGLCPEHKTKPEEVEEENYFFKLSNYQDKLVKLYESDTIKITPDNRKNEVVAFIKSGLEDFSISRSNERAKNWGIQVPDDPNQRIYVWFDALSNYITGIGYADETDEYKKWWGDAMSHKAHMLGKGIVRFHAIYWPAMLMSAGVPLPNELFVHGYITIEGEKMSKTLGNVLDPVELVDEYGLDPLRYFLIREIPSHSDGDFSRARLMERYQSDLANNLGNLVSRVAKLIETKLEGTLIFKQAFMSERVENEIEKTEKIFHEKMRAFRLHEALSDIWTLLSFANSWVDEKKPWKQASDNPEEFLRTMTSLVKLIIEANRLLQPFMPETSEKIAKIFGVTGHGENVQGQPFVMGEVKPLFPRLHQNFGGHARLEK